MNDNKSKIWTIETQDNRIEATHADGSRVYISLNPDGSIQVSTRWTLTITCNTGSIVTIRQAR